MKEELSKYSEDSKEVLSAKISDDKFSLKVLDCYVVNGSKYKPRHWTKDIYEVVTDKGVYICSKDLTPYKNKLIFVTTNKDKSDIIWIWLNFKGLPTDRGSKKYNHTLIGKDVFYEIDEALSLEPPEIECYVYKLKIGHEVYIGFTTKKPKERVAEHIAASKDGGIQKVNKALRRWGYFYELEILESCENEIIGLLKEIVHIKEHDSSLNEHPGGQGNDFNIVMNKNKMDEDVYYVHDKKNILNLND